jgi:hypothetical protein
MALIAKSAGQRNLRNLQVATGQKRLRSSDAYAPHIFADRAAEVLVELPANLDRMSPDAARQIS